MNSRLTQEQVDALRPLERFLHSAHYANYITGMNRATALTIFAIYNEARGQHFGAGEASCNYCRLEACRWLGMHYYAFLDAEEAVTDAQDTLQTTQTGEVEEVPTEEKKVPQTAKNAPKRKRNAKK